MAIIPFNKRYGETLAIMLQRFRLVNPEYADVKITYAGRLDPMAEGLMILLTGEDVHRKDEFLGLDKTYEVEFILGAKTDTYDVLGMVSSQDNARDVAMDTVKHELGNLVGEHDQKYPAYSSKTVDGKPLWKWARDGALNTIEIPSRHINVYNVMYLGHSVCSEYDVFQSILRSVSLVKGDFRQAEIIENWKDFCTQHAGNYYLCTARFTVSSGTYIRSLVHGLGKTLGVGGVCVKITRKKIGDYVLD